MLYFNFVYLYVQKMQCFFVQLFSRGTAVGIRVYREAKVAGLEDSEGTETFTRMLNDVFNALNTKLPSWGIRHNSKEIEASSSTNLSGA